MHAPARLPKTELPTLERGTSHFDLLNQLLAEQREMTAVEQFSHWHHSAAPASIAYQALLPTSEPQAGQQYAFEVDLKTNRTQIKQAVEKLFSVKVLRVNTMICRKEQRKLGKSPGKRQLWKKAIVKLKEGDKFDFVAS